ncbi:MAG: MMPL family transporter [Polyangia bacterium]|jgi:predicted RND superfamily exporter protein|nr:MMPL family transporter [Polyangia bacterium]
MYRLTAHLIRLLARYAAWSARRPLLPLVFLALVTSGAVAAAVHLLRLDPRFDALLPDGTPSVVARREATLRMGSSDLYLIAVESPDPVANYRFTRDAAAQIATWKETEWVLHRRDAEVFRKHALLFAEETDLAELATTLKRVVDRATKKAKAKATGFIELDDDHEEKEKKADESDRARLKSLAKKYRKDARIDREGDLFKEHPELKDALVNDKGTVAVVLARLTRGTNDVEFARQVYLRGNRLIETLGPATYHPKMIAKVGGAYRSFKEYDQALADVKTASVASLIMVLALLLLFFRRLRAIAIILVPLLVGIAWAAGFAALAVGTMNIITSFIVAILIGLGIDFAIHLYSAYRNARMEGADLADGLAKAVTEAGPGMFTAALTTVAALLTLVLAHFRAFQEFGLIAAAGVVLCLLSALLVLPPVVAAMDRVFPARHPAGSPDERVGSLGRLRSLSIAAGALALTITALLAWRAPRIRFEYDFKALRGKGAAEAGIAYGSAMRGSRGTSPMVLLGSSPDQLRLAHLELERRQKAEQACCESYLAGKRPQGEWCRRMGLESSRTREMVYHREDRSHCRDPRASSCRPRRIKHCQPRVQDLVTVATFIPARQEAKLGHIASIRQTLTPTKSTDPILDSPEDIQEDLKELQRYAQVDRPLSVEILPTWAKRTMTERQPGLDGKPRIGAVGLVYQSLSFRDVRDMIALARDYGTVPAGKEPVRLASSSFVVSDVVATVRSDGGFVFLYAGVAVAIILLLDLLSLSGALLCLLTLGVGLLWSVGFMEWLGWKFGVYNLLVVPTALGMGIDSTVHIYHRWRRLGFDYARSPLGHTGVAIIASAVTTAAGFAGLFFIQHGGLRTIAQFGTVSLLLVLLAVLTILPGVLVWRARRLPASKEEGGPGSPAQASGK